MYDLVYVLLILTMIFAFAAQFRVSGTFKKYSKVGSRSGLTGAQAARRLLDEAGMSDVSIERISGKLSDHYDPRDRIIRLSEQVHDSSSIAALGVAAHETGHAIQHENGYTPLALRNSILPAVNIGTQAAWPIFILGLVITGWSSAAGNFGYLIMQIGIALFCVIALFQIVTLPVELNASKRAVAMLEGSAILTSEESVPAKKVLDAAALTYIAALAVTLAQLLRMLVMSNRRR